MMSRLIAPAARLPIPAATRSTAPAFVRLPHWRAFSSSGESTSSTTTTTTIIYPDGTSDEVSAPPSEVSLDSAESSSMTITKSDIAKIICAEHGLGAKQSERILNTLFDTIIEAVSKNHTVQISKFGKFYAKTHAARHYHNIQSKQLIWKEASVKPKFQPYTNFQDCVSSAKKTE
mmetsp:Transcript_15312/g.31069  ORF Transcript_15312/g.31069 Transcript_15312/m.31069 type:complete len:175 (+) Transcript_15312:35-559(+)